MPGDTVAPLDRRERRLPHEHTQCGIRGGELSGSHLGRGRTGRRYCGAPDTAIGVDVERRARLVPADPARNGLRTARQLELPLRAAEQVHEPDGGGGVVRRTEERERSAVGRERGIRLRDGRERECDRDAAFGPDRIEVRATRAGAHEDRVGILADLHLAAERGQRTRRETREERRRSEPDRVQRPSLSR